ncbi:hypothetical protein P8452_54692 [Trifolium repens]|nr:hypothetical protein P8452_54692 [Trifolium repens]
MFLLRRRDCYVGCMVVLVAADLATMWVLELGDRRLLLWQQFWWWFVTPATVLVCCYADGCFGGDLLLRRRFGRCCLAPAVVLVLLFRWCVGRLLDTVSFVSRWSVVRGGCRWWWCALFRRWWCALF